MAWHVRQWATAPSVSFRQVLEPGWNHLNRTIVSQLVPSALHRITEGSGLKGTLKLFQFQPSTKGRDTFHLIRLLNALSILALAGFPLVKCLILKLRGSRSSIAKKRKKQIKNMTTFWLMLFTSFYVNLVENNLLYAWGKPCGLNNTSDPPLHTAAPQHVLLQEREGSSQWDFCRCTRITGLTNQ